jgi:hypothetical protein
MCLGCLGDGMSGLFNDNECGLCDGSGKIHTLCLHPYQGGTGSTVNGPINNFLNIDTSATQVMATYQFLKKDKINFRYGGKSGNLSSNGSGVRLNSTWFRKFSLAPVMSTLPAKMESFTAIHLNNSSKVDLKWITSSEINVSHYVVEKSFDGKTYNEAGLVFAYGNSSEKMTYTFTDNINTDNDKVIYYRLRTVDLDGKLDYSLTRIIKNSTQNETIASILTYPNPVTNELRVTIPNNWQGKSVSYEIFNAGGISHQKTVASSGSQTETLNVSTLAPGMYLVKASCGAETAQQKIIKR